MDEQTKSKARMHALQNALKFNGKANPGAVIGKILAENPELKQDVGVISKEIAAIVTEVNSLSSDQQQSELNSFGPIEEKKEAKEKDIFDFLEIKPGEKIKTAFPPEPSKYPHIGHAKAIILNHELAKKHKGKFYLRFEDTNPELVEKEFYKIHLENYKWLGIIPDKVDIVSDFMEDLYKYAEKFVREGNAYICYCAPETMKENRQNCVECECRKKSGIEDWEKLFKAKEGTCVLRLKGNMQSNNTTLKDPVIFRIIDKPHARQKKKYRLWPNYDFENGIMDGIEGITHRLRTKEFELRNELQRLIQKFAGFPETKIYEFARFNLEGVESSGRIIREKVQKKELLGWDDPSLTTLVALRRRGFLPETVKEFVLSTGITKHESVLTWDDLIVHNRRILDKRCSRYFFVEGPKMIHIKDAPKQEVELKLHPEMPEKGVRKFKTESDFYITEKDLVEIKEGKIIRLMDCLNFIKKGDDFVFDSLDYARYKANGDRIIHWLPVEKGLVNVEILMPNKEIRKGLAEPDVKKLKVNDIVQFARFGFCRLDKKEKEKLIFWYTHG